MKMEILRNWGVKYMKELYLCGNEKEIVQVLDYVKKKDLLSKGKIFLIDLLPELDEDYMKENNILRK